jgi:uncharacterized membrane protein YfcA
MGLTTGTVLQFYGLALPFLFLGWWLGSMLYGRIQESLYRRLILIVLGCMGLAMVWQGLSRA